MKALGYIVGFALIAIIGVVMLHVYFGSGGTAACLFADDPWLCAAVDRNR